MKKLLLLMLVPLALSVTSCDEDDSVKNEFKPEAVDLGLSVKWATCNVGATKPEEYGDYFAWGETSAKTTYSWDNYKYCQGTDSTMTKYCTSSEYGTVDNKTVLEPADDAATANWGAEWRMPTEAELEELLTKCTVSLTTQNNVWCYRIEGPNGNCIYLPAAGWYMRTNQYNVGSSGYYWSSSLGASYTAILLGYDPGSDGKCSGIMSAFGRSEGLSVRPVCK